MSFIYFRHMVHIHRTYRSRYTCHWEHSCYVRLASSRNLHMTGIILVAVPEIWGSIISKTPQKGVNGKNWLRQTQSSLNQFHNALRQCEPQNALKDKSLQRAGNTVAHLHNLGLSNSHIPVSHNHSMGKILQIAHIVRAARSPQLGQVTWHGKSLQWLKTNQSKIEQNLVKCLPAFLAK